MTDNQPSIEYSQNKKIKRLQDGTKIWASYDNVTKKPLLIIDNLYDTVIRLELHNEKEYEIVKEIKKKISFDFLVELFNLLPDLKQIDLPWPYSEEGSITFILFKNGNRLFANCISWLIDDDLKKYFVYENHQYSLDDIFVVQQLATKDAQDIGLAHFVRRFMKQYCALKNNDDSNLIKTGNVEIKS